MYQSFRTDFNSALNRSLAKVDFAVGLDGVDPGRLVAVGASFAGFLLGTLQVPRKTRRLAPRAMTPKTTATRPEDNRTGARVHTVADRLASVVRRGYKRSTGTYAALGARRSSGSTTSGEDAIREG